MRSVAAPLKTQTWGAGRQGVHSHASCTHKLTGANTRTCTMHTCTYKLYSSTCGRHPQAWPCCPPTRTHAYANSSSKDYSKMVGALTREHSHNMYTPAHACSQQPAHTDAATLEKQPREQTARDSQTLPLLPLLEWNNTGEVFGPSLARTRMKGALPPPPSCLRRGKLPLARPEEVCGLSIEQASGSRERGAWSTAPHSDLYPCWSGRKVSQGLPALLHGFSVLVQQLARFPHCTLDHAQALGATNLREGRCSFVKGCVWLCFGVLPDQ